MIAAAIAGGPVRIDGSSRLRERPMQDGIEAAPCALNVEVDECDTAGCLPVVVHPNGTFGPCRLQIASSQTSQFISALMLIGAVLPEGIVLDFSETMTSASYVELTAHVLEQWGVGVEIEQSGDCIRHVRIRPGMIAARSYTVPGCKLVCVLGRGCIDHPRQQSAAVRCA